jgi:cation-transporting ATPase E
MVETGCHGGLNGSGRLLRFSFVADPAVAEQPSGFATGPEGLTAAEVADRERRGLVNAAGERTSRSLREIARANIFTRFNAILGTLFVLILVFGESQDALFGIVLVTNALIGIVQEWRAKRTLDRLAVLSAPSARVVRDGTVRELAVEAVVLDDLLDLRTGDQVVTDGVIRSADGLEIDESLLTGESEPVGKAADAGVLSGSFVVAGRGRYQATRVGADSYARQLATEARRFTLTRSELVDGTNRILRLVQWTIVPTAALLAFSQFTAFHDDFRSAVASAIAGVVAMIPEGLVLLTSLAFALAAVTLARRRVLVQELPAVEGLARVDVVMLDKTGTITEGAMRFDELEALADRQRVGAALGALAADADRNATMQAVAEAFAAPADWTRTGAVPFSSARKWSAATFDRYGTWVFGAPEMVWVGRPADDPVRLRGEELATAGRRVVLLAHTEQALNGETLPAPLDAAAFVMFDEKIRPDAAETLGYFAAQGVACKVMSGDNPRTVGAIAARVGIEGAAGAVDGRELPEEPAALGELLESTAVVGRVTPHQKRAIVAALQQRGHVVAMTGDGVNDALALKDADLGIAMGSGAPATRAVAQMVLLDGQFAVLPGVVAEGRRVIANIERVANLFVTKTVYALLLALAVGVLRWPYPFLPRHLTIVSSLTIGIPAFFLALGPSRQRYVPGFVNRVLRFASRAGLVAAAATFTVYAFARGTYDVSLDQERTAATITLMCVGLWILGLLARPFTRARVVLVAAMAGSFALTLLIPSAREFFAFDIPPLGLDLVIATVVVVAIGILELGWHATHGGGTRDVRTAADS